MIISFSLCCHFLNPSSSSLTEHPLPLAVIFVLLLFPNAFTLLGCYLLLYLAVSNMSRGVFEALVATLLSAHTAEQADAVFDTLIQIQSIYPPSSVPEIWVPYPRGADRNAKVSKDDWEHFQQLLADLLVNDSSDEDAEDKQV